MPASIKKRARDAMRLELANAAVDAVIEGGFDAMTADDIAAAIGMSRATFFRQFGSKEGVMVASFVGTSAQFADAFRAAAETRGTWWEMLRAAVEPAVLFCEANPARLRTRMQFLANHPGISARLRQERAPQIEELAKAMTEAGGDPFACQILANAAISTLDQSLVYWKRNEDRAIRDVVDEAFARLAQGDQPA